MRLGYLRARGLVIQRCRVRKLLAEVDPAGTAERWSRAVKRRTYRVRCSNALWHMDSHMKLIRWGFVTHGAIDGFSRVIIYLNCTLNNNASSVLEAFAKSVGDYGLPSRVRSDHGGENILVAVIVNVLRGEDRGSHITGRSVHNQRIERLWRDVFMQVIQQFYLTVYSFEDEGILSPDNLIHRNALHTVFLPIINERLQEFQNAWNHHKIRTPEGSGLTPHQSC